MNKTPNTNKLASLLHPNRQNLIITDIKEFNKTTKLYTFKSNENKELAYYEAGSYIPVFVELDGNIVERPYSLCSSPKEAEEGIYKICVKANDEGYVSTHIINNWQIGDIICVGSPLVAEVYSPMRDKKHVVALAGGVGVTPFYSMAKAIVDGDNNHFLTLLYGANTYDEVLFKDDWKQLEKDSNGKVKVVFVIANEEVKGCEKGFITLDIINKYVDPKDCSFFISGSAPMVKAMKKILESLQLSKKQIRVSMNGDSAFNKKEESESYNLIIHMNGNTYTTKAKANETILVAIEKARLKPAAHCRSGLCGFCRSYVVNGTFTLATEDTGVRKADQKLGFIHPCCSYPTSDLEIVVQRSK